MEAEFCIEALEEALAKHGTPDIFNTDQGSQFTSAEFTGVLIKNGIAISMDGKGSWRDNVFVERLWRSVKYEEVYLRAYNTVSEARASISQYLGFYNSRRPHSSLDRQTPDQAYFTPLPHVASRGSPRLNAVSVRSNSSPSIVSVFARRWRRGTAIEAASTTWLSIPFAARTRWIQNPSNPIS